MPCGLAAAHYTGVKLADTMAMGPTVIPRERFVGRPRGTSVIGHGIGRINFPDIMARLAKMQDRWSKR